MSPDIFNLDKYVVKGEEEIDASSYKNMLDFSPSQSKEANPPFKSNPSPNKT